VIHRPSSPPLFPYTTLFRSVFGRLHHSDAGKGDGLQAPDGVPGSGVLETVGGDRHLPHSPSSFRAVATTSSGDSPQTTARRLPFSSETKAVSRMPSSHSATAPRAERPPAPVSARRSRSACRSSRSDGSSRAPPTAAPAVPVAASTASAP